MIQASHFTHQFLSTLPNGTADLSANELAVLAHCAALDTMARVDPTIAASTLNELRDQARRNLKLIASENFSSLATQLAQGNWLTDKYAEGTSSKRFYNGCDNVDAIEAHAAGLARKLFNAEYAFVQPHSGSDANLIAFIALLRHKLDSLGYLSKVEPELSDILAKGVADRRAKGNKAPENELIHDLSYNLGTDDWNRLRKLFFGQRLLALDLPSGGHLTHGYKRNISALLFDCHFYKVESDTGLIDYAKLREQARALKPTVMIAGYSAYPRLLDFEQFRSIADEVGAYLMSDMAHFAGLVAGGVLTGKHNPIEYSHVVTSTTHKTLRGPRGGLVLSKAPFDYYIDKACPLAMGGPLPHAMAAKAVAFGEALQPSFKAYAQQIVKNAQALAERLMQLGHVVPSGGTDNHLVLVRTQPELGITGAQAADALREAAVTVNKNSVPGDAERGVSPLVTGGLRLGAPALTTLGMKQPEMVRVANVIDKVLRNTRDIPKDQRVKGGKTYTLDAGVVAEAKTEVQSLLREFPLYPELQATVFAGEKA